ncbi:hypothetical protein J6590_031067 [Homalodisca vitripennis]|nr:hypothetical protein J6590_031067 [Homalodisca vitripennis]
MIKRSKEVYYMYFTVRNSVYSGWDDEHNLKTSCRLGSHPTLVGVIGTRRDGWYGDAVLPCVARRRRAGGQMLQLVVVSRAACLYENCISSVAVATDNWAEKRTRVSAGEGFRVEDKYGP